MSKKIKIGILGCGPRGLQMGHIANLLPEICELRAMSDTDPKALDKAADAFSSVKLFDNSDALLEEGDVDAVITEIPPAYHTEYVCKALTRGIHVLGEIPAVDSIEEGEKLWKVVNANKALYMCGSNPNYRAKTKLALKLKEMGLLGEVAYIESEYMHDMRSFADTWRATYESCRYCTHSLGPILEILGDDEFVSVTCMSTGNRIKCNCTHNAMAALLRSKNGIVVRFLTAFSLPYKGPAHTTALHTSKGIIKLYNEKASIWLEGLNEFSAKNDFIDITLTPTGNSRPQGMEIIDEDVFAKSSWGHNGSDNLMLEDFIDAIVNGKESPIGIKKALAMTLPGIYAAQSAQEGGTLQEIKYPWS